MFEKGQILRIIWISLYNWLFFCQTSKRGLILTKTLFPPKVFHIELNYAFLLFLSIFGEIHRELLCLVKKVAISERSTEILVYTISF